MAAQRHITIVGAGISGLVLGRCLLRRGIPFRLLDKDKGDVFEKRHGYGIELHPWAYKPLLKELDMDEMTFRKRVAVDGEAARGSSAAIRVHRRRLEQMLSEGLKPEWDQKITDGGALQDEIVVGTDGPHSFVRSLVSPSSKLDSLPFAAFFGRRRVSPADFESTYAEHFKQANSFERRIGSTLLRIGFDGMVNDKDYGVSYTYSRPALDSDDALYRPNRPTGDANSVPIPLEKEIDSLGSVEQLDGLFQTVFNPAEMKKDRILHWVMRSVLVNQSDLEIAARERSTLLIGDAAHHGPIIGSEGACHGIKDAIDLADFLAQEGQELQIFYSKHYDSWKTDFETARAKFFEKHNTDIKSVL